MVRELHIVEDLPGYLLGCLEAEEVVRVEEHLESCEACRRELAAFQEVSALFAASLVQIDPPERVKRELMARVEGARPHRKRAGEKSSWWMRLMSGFRKVSPAWGAVSLVLILVLGVSNLFLWRQVQKLKSGQGESLQVVSLSGTERMPAATGIIVISRDGRHGTLVVDQLPDLGDESEYQLWLIRDEQRISGAVFSVSKDGYGAVYVSSPDPLSSYAAFGVTIEPKGGSAGPTGEKVLGGDL
jgi:anti-sigma-K factor RskA